MPVWLCGKGAAVALRVSQCFIGTGISLDCSCWDSWNWLMGISHLLPREVKHHAFNSYRTSQLFFHLSHFVSPSFYSLEWKRMCWVSIPRPVSDIFHRLCCSGTDEWCVSLRWVSASKLSARETEVGIPKQQATMQCYDIFSYLSTTQPTGVRVWVRKGCHTPTQWLGTFTKQNWLRITSSFDCCWWPLHTCVLHLRNVKGNGSSEDQGQWNDRECKYIYIYFGFWISTTCPLWADQGLMQIGIILKEWSLSGTTVHRAHWKVWWV